MRRDLISTDDSARLVEQVRARSPTTTAPIRGGDSKVFLGRTVVGADLDTRAHRGIVSYDPSELVITARAGTPLAELNAILADAGQMLPCEPPAFGGDSDRRRRGRERPVGSAPAVGGFGARLHPWLPDHHGRSEASALRRAGHEERGGLRRVASHRRQLRLSRAHHRSLAESAAEAARSTCLTLAMEAGEAMRELSHGARRRCP